jgi:Concanavalin A-like lectin/glucanases superfamily
VNLRSGDASGSLLRSVYGGDSLGYRDGRLEESPEMDAGAFPSPENIGYLRWALQRRERLADPGLIAWFPFERGANASLLVNAVREYGVPDGRIVGARWATGRWPGKQALWFDQESDFVEIEIPGEHTELTLAVWLKVERLDREMIAILNSNGMDNGDFHFQMNRLGLPRGGLQGVDRVFQRWVGNPIPIGKWVHVVSVTSLPQRRSVIYVNGQPVHEAQLADDDVLIQPGQCRLGNWFAERFASREASRALRGLVDELSVWNRALSASEVAALTESGRPSLLWSRENPPLKVPLPKF